MKITLASFKGGVGKSSLALNLAIYLGFDCVTNDIVAIDNSRTKKIPPKLKRIPLQYCGNRDLILDFGATSTSIDPKLAHAVRMSNLVVIPTLTDTRSLKATVDTVNFVQESAKPIVIIINNFTDNKKYLKADAYLHNALVHCPVIYSIRTTTLFERVASDGEEWLLNVHHRKGEYQLNKTSEAHHRVYDAIASIGRNHATTDA